MTLAFSNHHHYQQSYNKCFVLKSLHIPLLLSNPFQEVDHRFKEVPYLPLLLNCRVLNYQTQSITEIISMLFLPLLSMLANLGCLYLKIFILKVHIKVQIKREENKALLSVKYSYIEPLYTVWGRIKWLSLFPAFRFLVCFLLGVPLPHVITVLGCMNYCLFEKINFQTAYL